MSESRGYETLDHTADIQFHSWGTTMKEAFEQIGLCMFDYVTELQALEIDDSLTHDFEASGHDMESLLFAYMDELLFQFSAEMFTPKEIEVLELDEQSFQIKCLVKGETFDRQKHPMGCEIKAITYSNMQIHQTDGKVDLFVIVDI
ncbi:putative Archease [Blattamonas nauphoetae]|uniref:Archease n=1 Tax=Blattamonas nauphoetae TaxID=2049346 RepID=A0ABQ9XR19_9EUKA|nr:putative Archease [Blattamonas nauphoetae]